MPRAARSAFLFAVGALGAALPALALGGFTVDDALIPARYAAHLAAGIGYRFNAGGAVTDGVTPLGWSYLLAPFASAAAGGVLGALAAAKWIGFGAWCAAAGVLAMAIDRVGGRRPRFGALLLLFASAPLAAWSVAGLETGVVTALAAVAVALRELDRPLAGAACAGLAAALRPEMLPWAMIVSVAPRGVAPGDGSRPPVLDEGVVPGDGSRPLPEERFGGAAAQEGSYRETTVARALRAALGAAGFVVVAVVRWSCFGRVAPLSALAKPADLALGARYALACLVLTGPVALLAPRTWARLGPWPRWLLAAVGAHFIAVALAGGDWMPLSRLVAPVLPSVALAAAHVASVARLPFTAARFALALAGEVFAFARVGPSAARVGGDRTRLLEELGGVLRRGQVIAALDVGWIGAATDATIVDLAGLTDPAIASLPGGHITKRIPPALLDARGVDTLVLLLGDGEALASPWTESGFARELELRIARFPGVGEEFAPVATGEIPHLRYVVLRRR